MRTTYGTCFHYNITNTNAMVSYLYCCTECRTIHSNELSVYDSSKRHTHGIFVDIHVPASQHLSIPATPRHAFHWTSINSFAPRG